MELIEQTSLRDTAMQILSSGEIRKLALLMIKLAYDVSNFKFRSRVESSHSNVPNTFT